MTSQTLIEASPIRDFIEQYFEAWQGSVAENILSYFSEDAVISLWGDGATLTGKKMVGEQWIIPMVKNYPGNTHQIKTYLESGDQVTVEWVFSGVHASTGKEITLQGCSIYWLRNGLIERGHVYFSNAKAKREQSLSALERPSSLRPSVVQ